MRGSIIIFVFLICCIGFRSVEAMTKEQREEIARLTEQSRQAGQLFAEGKLQESADKVIEVQKGLVMLMQSDDPTVHRAARPLYQRLARAHALLELEGAELETLPDWQELTSATKPSAGTSTKTVSFTKDLAPWFVSTCGNCHISNQRGNFSMASYGDLMRGSQAGRVLFPGSAQGSRLVEVIESGDMPRGGGKVSAEQLAALKTWIDEGAVFDGENPAAQLTTYVSSEEATSPSAEPRMANGSETVSFAKDVAPILNENCNGCHIGGRQSSGNFSMQTFSRLLRGGDSGSVINERNAEDSLIIRKLRGQSGQRMPAGGRPALPESQIATIATWISEGAAFDGPSADLELPTLVRQAWANDASHAELFAWRKQRATEQLRRVIPNDEPETMETDELRILGNTSKSSLESVRQSLERAIAKLSDTLKLRDEPLIKGGLTVYLLRNRYDYSEFGRMIESRELPREWLGHARAGATEAYVAMVDDNSRDAVKTDALALQLVTHAYFGALGAPAWFAEGLGRNMVVSNYRREDERITQWQTSLPTAQQTVESQKLLEGKADDEAAALIGILVTKPLLERGNRRRLNRFLEQLQAGQDFETALSQSFTTPQAMVKQYLRQ